MKWPCRVRKRYFWFRLWIRSRAPGRGVRGETLGKVLSVQGSDIGHAQGVPRCGGHRASVRFAGRRIAAYQFVAEFCEFRDFFPYRYSGSVILRLRGLFPEAK